MTGRYRLVHVAIFPDKQEFSAGRGIFSVELPRRGVPAVHEDEELSGKWLAEFEPELRELCVLKAAEFSLLGYDHVKPEEIWDCVMALKKNNGRLHEWVDAILTLQVGQFMNYETMNAFKGKI